MPATPRLRLRVKQSKPISDPIHCGAVLISNFTEENRRKKLTLVGTATQAFRLVRVNSDNPAVVCTWDDESNNTNTDISIEIFIDDRQIAEGFRGQLEIEVESNGLSTLVVPYTVMKNKS